jgi:dCTP deaminase
MVLLPTRERVRIPAHLAAEVRLMDPRSGNFVAHGAGFIDAGYGWSDEGLPVTLEIGGVEEGFILYHGRRICLLSLEQLRVPAQNPYAGNYKSPRLLPKQFK